MTREFMDAQLGRLVILRGMPGDTDEYFPALEDVSEDIFAAACTHAMKTRAWFPIPAELRADCDAVRLRVRVVEAEPSPSYRDLQEAQTREIKNPLKGGKSIWVKVVREWNHDCGTCSDTGWATRFCGPVDQAVDNQQAGHCGRRFEHGSHAWVERCSCIEWNPTIRRRKEAQTKYSQAPEKVGA
jgi:hypothetical protein